MALGLTVPWSDVTYEEARALVILRQEQDALQEEEAKRREGEERARQLSQQSSARF